MRFLFVAEGWDSLVAEINTFLALDQSSFSLFSPLVCLLFLQACLCLTHSLPGGKFHPLMPRFQITLDVVHNSLSNTSSMHPAFSVKHTRNT